MKSIKPTDKEAQEIVGDIVDENQTRLEGKDAYLVAALSYGTGENCRLVTGHTIRTADLVEFDDKTTNSNLWNILHRVLARHTHITANCFNLSSEARKELGDAIDALGQIKEKHLAGWMKNTVGN